MGNMREISIQECNAVFGGTDEAPESDTIIVSVTRRYSDSNSLSNFSWGDFGGSGFGSFGVLGAEAGGISLLDFVLPSGWDLGATNNSLVDTDGDGVPDSPEIVVNAPPIIDFDSSIFGSFYARLAGDGTYIQQQLLMQNYGIWGTTLTYTPIAYGTYTEVFSDGSFSVGFPVGASYTFGGTSYGFQRLGTL